MHYLKLTSGVVVLLIAAHSSAASAEAPSTPLSTPRATKPVSKTPAPAVAADSNDKSAVLAAAAASNVHSVGTPNVCAEQLIGKGCTRDAMHKQVSGTVTCAVHPIGEPQHDLAALQRKLDVTYRPSLRSCTKGKLQGSVVASKTTLSFAIASTGRVANVTSAGADESIAACVAKLANTWSFGKSVTAKGVTRVEVVVETNPTK